MKKIHFREDMINVLWVENDPEIIEAEILDAEGYGINLVNFPNWKEAEEFLIAYFDQWGAIVLDAKCQYTAESHDVASTFLMQSIASIMYVCAAKKRIIPWYIYTGGTEEDLNDLIPDFRKAWDSDWKKKFYSKSTDSDVLYHRIKYHAYRSPLLQIRETLYPDVFRAISSSGLEKVNDDIASYFEDLLLPIHFIKERNNYYIKNGFAEARKIIECVILSMIRNGFLPKELQESNGGVNIGYSINLLSKVGTFPDNKRNLEFTSHIAICEAYPVIIDTLNEGNDIRIVNRELYLGNMIRNSNWVCGSAVHQKTTDNINNKNVPLYLDTVGGTPYLLQSITLRLCDLVIWYADYLSNHGNYEENCKNWTVSKIESSEVELPPSNE